MPSVNPKTEKIPAAETSDSLRQAIVIIEHKIRNLEKRKAKLDSYKESGKALTREQTEAISKYDGVVQQLELSKDYVKQFMLLCIESDKLKKKAAKKEILERTTAETNKIKQVLVIQDVLQVMGTDQAREDFLAGQNGATQLTDVDLKVLDDLYVEVVPKHEGPIPFTAQVQKAAENLMAIADGRTREVAGSTGIKIQALINSINSSGYFNQEPETVENANGMQPEQAVDEITTVSEDQTTTSSTTPVPVQDIPVPATQQMPVAPNIPTANPIHVLKSIVPVSQVESSMFNAQGFQPPNNTAPGVPVVPPPNAAPTLNDVMSRVPVNFTFFQDSELEATDLNAINPAVQGAAGAATIPTRTFTNQAINGGQAPPPAAMAYPNPPNNNPYFVGGYPPQAPPHFAQEMIQGVYPVAGNNAMPAMQQQISANDTANRAYSQTPQHIAASYPPISAPPTAIPPNNIPPPYTVPSQINDEAPTPVVEERKEEPRQEWNEQIGDWGSNQFDKWDEKGTEAKKSHRGSNNRGGGDRPRNSNNYQGNRRNNRDRDSSNNYYNNNQNGYRGDFQPRENRDYHPRGDRGDRSGNDANGGGGGQGYGGYRRNGPPRGPRPDRPDRPQGNSAPRNSGPRPPRNNQQRAPSGQQANA